MASHVEAVAVQTEDSAMRRIRARWFGAEIVWACRYATDAGPLAYVHAIEKEANEATSVSRFTLIVRFDHIMSEE